MTARFVVVIRGDIKAAVLEAHLRGIRIAAGSVTERGYVAARVEADESVLAQWFIDGIGVPAESGDLVTWVAAGRPLVPPSMEESYVYH